MPAGLRDAQVHDWERTIPTVQLGDEPRTVELLDFFGGWLEGLKVLAVEPAEAAAPKSPAGAPVLKAESIEDHRIRLALPGTGGSTAPPLCFVRFSVDIDSSAPLERVIVVRGEKQKSQETTSGFHPVPYDLESRAGNSDGAFAWVGAAEPPPIRPNTLFIVFGNEWIPLRASDDRSTAVTPGDAASALEVEWLEPGRFVVRGLRDLAAERPSDSIIRIFVKTNTNEWVESAFPFGGQLRPQFEPRDSIYYFALVDRLRDGDRGNNDPLSPSEGLHPLDNWAGGDAKGIRSWVESGYFKNFGSVCLVLSSAVRQAGGMVTVPDSAAPPGARVEAPYRGLFPATFGEPEPRFGSLDDWLNTLHAIHVCGMFAMFDYSPWAMHESGDLVASDPGWFQGDMPEGLKSSANPSNGRFDEYPDRSEWRAPSLRYASWGSDPEAQAAFSGYALWWLRLLKADGVRFLGNDFLSPDYLTLFSTRLREEIARPARHGLYVVGEPFRTEGDESGESEIIRALDGTIDLPLTAALRSTLAEGKDSLVDLDAAVRRSWNQTASGAIPCVVSGSAELPRMASLATAEDQKENPADTVSQGDDSRLSPDQAHRLLFTALFTLPPVPGVYYGDEIAMDGAVIPENRAPLPKRMSWDRSQRDRYELARTLADLRFHHPALRRGTYQTLAIADDLLVYARAAWSEAVVVAINRSGTDQEVEIEIPRNLASAKALVSLLPEKGQGAFMREGRARLTVPPRTTWIYQVR